MTRFKYYFVTFLDVRFGRLDFKAFAAPRSALAAFSGSNNGALPRRPEIKHSQCFAPCEVTQ